MKEDEAQKLFFYGLTAVLFLVLAPFFICFIVVGFIAKKLGFFKEEALNETL